MQENKYILINIWENFFFNISLYVIYKIFITVLTSMDLVKYL